MLTLLALFSWKFKDVIGRETILNTSRLLIASIYFYSGLQKLNEEFIHTVFPWVIAPLAENFPFLIQQGFFSLGFFIPFIQMSIGIGLLTKKFRALAIVLATIMCFFLLSMLGPWGHNWNSVVWPWNIALLLMVVILFAHTPRVAMQDILIIKNSIVHKIILLVFGFLPLLYFFNLWDSYLSWSLYSGTTNSGTIVLSQAAKNNLPIFLQSLTSSANETESLLSISDWAFAELNVPPYPETKVLKNVALQVCQMTKVEEETSLILSGRLSWFNSDNPQTLSCSELRQDR